MHAFRLLFLFAAGVLGCGSVQAANIVFNGSFEDNIATGTMFNLSNANLTSTVAHVTGVGTAQEIDLVTGSGWGVAPADGNWKLGLHRQVGDVLFDAFFIDLSTPVVAGQTYTLQVSQAAMDGLPAGMLYYGVSDSLASLPASPWWGIQVATTNWMTLTMSSPAPANGSYLAVWLASPAEGYAFIDNISLDDGRTGVPEPSAALLLLAGLVGIAYKRLRA